MAGDNHGVQLRPTTTARKACWEGDRPVRINTQIMPRRASAEMCGNRAATSGLVPQPHMRLTRQEVGIFHLGETWKT